MIVQEAVRAEELVILRAIKLDDLICVNLAFYPQLWLVWNPVFDEFNQYKIDSLNCRRAKLVERTDHFSHSTLLSQGLEAFLADRVPTVHDHRLSELIVILCVAYSALKADISLSSGIPHSLGRRWPFFLLFFFYPRLARLFPLFNSFLVWLPMMTIFCAGLLTMIFTS